MPRSWRYWRYYPQTDPAHRTFMLRRGRCCICRRRRPPWARARYLGMRCHRRCLEQQRAWLASYGYTLKMMETGSS